MKKFILLIICAVFINNAHAIWLHGSYNVAQMEHKPFTPTKQIEESVKQEKSINKELTKCFDNCAIDVDLLRQCRQQANTGQAKVKCIDFSKRECLIKCKEKELKEIKPYVESLYN